MSFKEIAPGLTQINVPIPKEGFENFLSTWLLRDLKRCQTILAETGPASSVPALRADLRQLGVESIDYLIYTHIHLDHSGGAGQFYQMFPETKIIVPAGGRAHLVTPNVLFQASLDTLGADIVGSYGRPFPLPSKAFADRTPGGLTVLNTPGHAPYHDSYLYELDGSRILFPGEAAGFFRKLPDGSTYQRPATPHRFFYDVAVESLDRLTAIGNVDVICYPHYGCALGCDAQTALKNARAQLELWKNVISGLTAETPVDRVFSALYEKDALLGNIEKLDRGGAEREKYFIMQSIRGFMGYIFS